MAAVRPFAPSGAAVMLWAAVGLVLATTLGLAAGNPDGATFALAVLVLGIVVVYGALRRPFAAYLVLATSPIFLISVKLPGNVGLNAFDLLMPPLLVAGIVGVARYEAADEDRTLAGPHHAAIFAATRRLSKA